MSSKYLMLIQIVIFCSVCIWLIQLHGNSTEQLQWEESKLGGDFGGRRCS